MNNVTVSIEKLLIIDLSDCNKEHIEKIKENLDIKQHKGEIDVMDDDVFYLIDLGLLNNDIKSYLNNISRIALKFD